MAYGKGKKRIQVAVSDELDERLTKLSEAFGVTKSAMCAMYIGQAAAGAEIAMNAAKGAADKLISDLGAVKEVSAE